MKVNLSPIIIRSVAGPSGSFRTLFPQHGETTIQQKPYRKRTRPKTKRPLFGPSLILPDTRNAECKAWTLADLRYQGFSVAERAWWRVRNRRPHTSAYDAWMKYSIPHYIRGTYPPTCPDLEYFYKLRELSPYPWMVWQEGHVSSDWIPPVSCQTHGVYTAFVAAWYNKHFIIDPTKQPKLIGVKIQSKAVYSDEPRAVVWRLKHYGKSGGGEVLFTTGWYSKTEALVAGWIEVAPPFRGWLELGPAVQDEAGNVFADPLVVPTTRITFGTFDSLHAFGHWPQLFPSTRYDQAAPPSWWHEMEFSLYGITWVRFQPEYPYQGPKELSPFP